MKVKLLQNHTEVHTWSGFDKIPIQRHTWVSGPHTAGLLWFNKMNHVGPYKTRGPDAAF